MAPGGVRGAVRTIVETTDDAMVAVINRAVILFANRTIEPLFGVLPQDAPAGHPQIRARHFEERVARELERDFKSGEARPNFPVQTAPPRTAARCT